MKSRRQTWKSLRRWLGKREDEANSSAPSQSRPKTSASYPLLHANADDLMMGASDTPTCTADLASDSSTPPPPVNERPDVLRICNSPHHRSGRTVVDAVVQCPLNEVYDLLFTPSKFFVDTLKSQNMTGISIGTWSNPDENGEQQRTTRFTVPVVGPGFTKIPSIQYLRLLACSDASRFYAIDARMDHTGIPYGDSFYVQIHYCVEKVSPNSTRILVTADLKYVKSVWRFVKQFIDQLTWGNLDKFYNALKSQILQLNDMTPEQRRRLMEVADCQRREQELNAAMNPEGRVESAVRKLPTICSAPDLHSTSLNSACSATDIPAYSDDGIRGAHDDGPVSWSIGDEKLPMLVATFAVNGITETVTLLRRTVRASPAVWILLIGLILAVMGLGAMNRFLSTKLWAAEERLNFAVATSERLIADRYPLAVPQSSRELANVWDAHMANKWGNYVDDVKMHLHAAASALQTLRNELGLAELLLIHEVPAIDFAANATA